MSVLVVADHDTRNLNVGTNSVVTAANKLGDDVHVLVVGSECAQVASKAAEIKGVNKVLLAEAPYFAHQLAENLAAQVLTVAKNYTHILFLANSTGKAAAPRVAASLDVGQISEIIAVVDGHTYKRPLYAGAVIGTVASKDPIQVITVRTTAFEPEPMEGNGTIEALAPVADCGKARFLSESKVESDLPDLQNAKIVLAGGRGLANEEEFAEMEKLAHKMGAAAGTTRAVVDAGLAPNDWQIGQTGKIIAPDLYIGLGISGAIQHVAGIKDAKVIVAVNKDPEAPIFEIADYGLVEDAPTVIRELEKKL